MTSSVDLHMHSSASDGTDTPSLLPERIKEAGVRVFALTDHDTMDGVAQAQEALPAGVAFIPGIEFSCRAASGKCHILGLGCDREAPAFRAALAQGRALRRQKLDNRLAFLEERGFRFPQEEIRRLHGMPSAGKPHLGNLMVKYGYAESKNQAIRDVINLFHGGNDRIGAETAVRAILASGGVPIWAHPLSGDGDQSLTWEQFLEALEELSAYGLAGLECWYSEYPAARCQKLAATAEVRGLLVSGGSDYHGGNKQIPIGTLNAEGLEVAAERLTVLDRLRSLGAIRL